jgi:alkaline phosphatase
MPARIARVRILVAALAASLLVAAGCAHLPEPAPASPRNVILMIGDGMGAAHVTAGKIIAGNLEMERLTAGGLVTTYSADELVTDSAAGGTAYATGRKTRNGAISISPSGERLETVIEYAEQLGMATGLVVTCSVAHATPAAFAAHVENRDDYAEIARQMTASGVDVLFGGGRSYFLPQSEPGSARKDDEDLLGALRRRMPVALSADEFRALPDVEAAAALLASDDMGWVAERNPPLPELTEKALRILSKDADGFFLVIEGSQIDWAAHDNRENELVSEVLDFDRAVGVAMDFAERDGRTLVVVTADHETGAYAILDGSIERHEITDPRFGTEKHSATMVPLLAYGPGSGAFGGIEDNTDVGRTLIGFVTARP